MERTTSFRDVCSWEVRDEVGAGDGEDWRRAQHVVFGGGREGAVIENGLAGEGAGNASGEFWGASEKRLAEQSDSVELGPGRERQGSARVEGGEDWVKGVFAAEGVRITEEGDGARVTSEGYQSDVGGDLEERTVEVQAGVLEGEALRGCYGLSQAATLS